MADRDPEFQAWVDKASETDILEVAKGLTRLKRQGSEWAGPCPACGGDDKFSVSPKKRIFNCSHQGGPGGSVIDMLMHAKGLTFVQACEELTHEPPPKGASTEQDPEIARERREERRERDLARQREEDARVSRKMSLAEELWESRQPIIGSWADEYLRRRKIELERKHTAELGFLPAHPYRGYREDAGQDEGEVELGSWPILMAAVRDADMRLIGVNRTYLDRNEPRKLTPPGDRKRNKARKAIGVTLGGATYLEPPGETVAIGEGLETVLSWYAMARGPEDVTPVSSISLGNLAGSALGTMRHPKYPKRVIPSGEPDPAKPGLVLPPVVREVILIGDGDSDGPWTRAQLITARRKFVAGGLTVSVDLADPGKDFNDHLIAGDT